MEENKQKEWRDYEQNLFARGFTGKMGKNVDLQKESNFSFANFNSEREKKSKFSILKN